MYLSHEFVRISIPVYLCAIVCDLSHTDDYMEAHRCCNVESVSLYYASENSGA